MATATGYPTKSNGTLWRQWYPAYHLFAPDGTIVARNLRGDEMKQKVAEIMKDK